MFGSNKRKQLEELIILKTQVETIYKVLFDGSGEVIAILDKNDAKLSEMKKKIVEIQNTIDELINMYDNEIIEEVKLFLQKDMDREIRNQEEFFVVIENVLSNEISEIGKETDDLKAKLEGLYDEIRQIGIETVQEIAPTVIDSRVKNEIFKVMKSYLEWEIYTRSKAAFDKELEEKGIEMDAASKEACYKDILENSKRVVDTIMNGLIHEEDKIVNDPVKPFDRDKELVHKNFDKLLTCVEAGVIPMLVGPAGTGKSTAVEQVARKLGLKFYTMNRIQNAFELTGYNDAEGKYVSTQFYEAYTKGGIFFFDEIDASSPEALVTINTAIAQGYMAFPNGLVKMHPDFKVVAAGNTFGKGADRQYCGRNSLDSATLDRFMIIEWDYDRELEAKIIKDKELLEFAWAVRDAIDTNRLQIIISTRGIIATKKIIEASKGKEGFTIEEALEGNLFENVGIDALNQIIDQIDKDTPISNNKYYKALVRLKDDLVKKSKR